MRENGERRTDAARKEDESQAVGLDGDRADAIQTNNPTTESSLLNGPLTALAHRNEGAGPAYSSPRIPLPRRFRVPVKMNRANAILCTRLRRCDYAQRQS